MKDLEKGFIVRTMMMIIIK